MKWTRLVFSILCSIVIFAITIIPVHADPLYKTATKSFAVGTFSGFADSHSFEVKIKGEALVIRFDEDDRVWSLEEDDMIIFSYRTNEYGQHILTKLYFAKKPIHPGLASFYYTKKDTHYFVKNITLTDIVMCV
jgi:hypothetical protein